MTPTVLYTDFKILRQAYTEVKCFVEKEAGDEVASLKTKIEYDLGLAGDDNYELIKRFVTKYNLDTTGFNYSKHFLSEGELFDSGAALWALLSIPFISLFWTIKLLTLGRVDLAKKQSFPDFNRSTTDLSFGDLLTWYLTGKYTLREDITFKLSHAI